MNLLKLVLRFSRSETPATFQVGEDPWLVPSVADLDIDVNREWTTVTHKPTGKIIQTRGGSPASILQATLALGAALGQDYLLLDPTDFEENDP